MPTSRRLRILRSSTDLNDIAAEVPADEGTLLLFRNGPNAWHGFEPFSGPRRVIQVNWVTNESVVMREQSAPSAERLFQAAGRQESKTCRCALRPSAATAGGSSVYKALSHPLAAEPARALIAKLAAKRTRRHLRSRRHRRSLRHVLIRLRASRLRASTSRISNISTALSATGRRSPITALAQSRIAGRC